MASMREQFSAIDIAGIANQRAQQRQEAHAFDMRAGNKRLGWEGASHELDMDRGRWQLGADRDRNRLDMDRGRWQLGADRDRHGWEGESHELGMDRERFQLGVNQQQNLRDQKFHRAEDRLRAQQLEEASNMSGTNDRRFAEGGFVDPMMDPAAMDPALGLGGPPMGGMPMDGMPMGSGGAMDMAMGQGGMGGGDPMMEAYQVYMQSAEEMGLPPIPFEEFAGMMADQLAEGGDMGMGDPAVGGKMVIDPDPNAPTDSIPATIDGEHPARLDSGEFVIPAHAVMFHGIDKLKKLIAQAEQAEQMS